MYNLVLFVHSWLRWLVLLLGVLSLFRAGSGWLGKRPFAGADRGLQIAFTSALDLQVLLGLALYLFLSPFVPHSGPDFKVAMHSSQLRFVAVEHITVMLAVVVVAHLSAVRARRAPDDVTRHRRWALGLLSAVLLAVVGIPWPGLAYGRPLFRMFGG